MLKGRKGRKEGGKTMDLKEKIKTNIDELDSNLLQDVLEYINYLKQQKGSKNNKKDNVTVSHKDVQKMLSSSNTVWADDVSSEREERV